jgi:hypothetical protein
MIRQQAIQSENGQSENDPNNVAEIPASMLHTIDEQASAFSQSADLRYMWSDLLSRVNCKE